MVKAAIISLGSVSSKWTADAMRKYFESVDEINLKEIEVVLGSRGENKILVSQKPIGKYDCVYAKGSFRYSALLEVIATLISKESYMPYNPHALTLVHDKMLTQVMLEAENIPMPKTYVAATINQAKKILENSNYPIIMKIPSGTQGKGVMFAESYAAASSMLDTLETLRHPFIIQEYIETGNTDLRVIVTGDRIAATMRRRGKLDEKRANIHAGGIGEICEIDEKTKNIAIKTAKIVGAEIVGIDILDSARGPLVIEANISPGLQGITSATGVNVADRIAKYLYEKTLEWKQKDDSTGKTKMFSDLGIKDANSHPTEIITKLDFRASRVLLPELATKITKFNESDEYIMEILKDSLKIRKLK